MRWPWSRERSEDDALRAEQDRLDEIRDQWPAVEEAANKMTEHRRRNHFAESIALIYRDQK